MEKQHKGKVKPGVSANEELPCFLNPIYYTSDSIRDTTLLHAVSVHDVKTKTADRGSGIKEL